MNLTFLLQEEPVSGDHGTTGVVDREIQLQDGQDPDFH
jgi:hypothetical protein